MALINVSGFSKNIIESITGTEVEFDGYLIVTPTTSNTVTKRPIEDGFDITDAIHNNPTLLSVQIIVTDNAQTVIDSRAATNLPNILGTSFVQTYTKKQLDRLKQISDFRETVSLKTKYGEYENYFLENFTYTETDESGLRINFTLSENRTDVDVNTTDNIDDSIGSWS